MRVAIGLFAWNEADTILKTLESLLLQSLLQKEDPSFQIEIIALPNGSTDGTPALMRSYFESLNYPHLRFKICEITEAGKANAWNLFVHHFADPLTDYFFMMDGDIEIDAHDTLQQMLNLLITQPHVHVSTDLPKKHLLFKPHKSLLDRIHQGLARITQKTPGQLTGQLYALQGQEARRLWLPKGLMVEDGFIKQMVVTNQFRDPPDNAKIKKALGASHIFRAYTSFKEIFRHQVRQAVGQSMNHQLEQWIKGRLQINPQCQPGLLIEEQNRQDPLWLTKLIKPRLYPYAFTTRFRRLAHLSGKERLLFFPLACAAFLFDLPVLWKAKRQLKRMRETQKLWRKE